MEDLGHASAPYVEGLTVDLLPFQSQTVGWATEREQTPGGIQAFLSTKLPNQDLNYNSFLSTKLPNQDLNYNFVTGKLSHDKPHLVRGGIIAEQMGLGKTVISLALILRNPAPALPESGSATSSIDALPTISAGATFWDPDLYSRTSASKKKRGRIISRGTLVVVRCWMNRIVLFRD
jgi:SNF2 family DNA or RNA helicase